MSKLLSVTTVYSAFGDPGQIYPYPSLVKARVSTSVQGERFDINPENTVDVQSKVFDVGDIVTSVPQSFDSLTQVVSTKRGGTLSVPSLNFLPEATLSTGSLEGVEVMSAYLGSDEPRTLTDHQFLLTIDPDYQDPSEIPEPDSGFAHRDLVGGGDAKVTVDYYTGLEWLKLSNTEGLSIADVEQDSQFSEWRVATNFESTEFLNNLIRHIDSSATLFDTANGAPAVSRGYPTAVDNNIHEYLGGSSTYSYGWWYEYSSDQPNGLDDPIGGGGLWSNGSVYDWRYDQATDFSRAGTGVMLVRGGTEPNYLVQSPRPPKRDYFLDSDYYDFNGLRWLKIYHSLQISIEDFYASEYLQGHRLATAQEVKDLIASFVGSEPSSASGGPAGSSNATVVQNFYKAFGRSGVASGYLALARYLDDAGTTVKMAGLRDLSNYYYFDYTRTTNLSATQANDGLFLIKE